MSATTESAATIDGVSNDEFDPCLSEEEKRFYVKAYPRIDLVCERKVHCTVCKQHIGTAPCNESNIKMHPILRVTHCTKCHDFYNSGEFSRGEDGSELYCRWCGQGGEVYCCSNCPFVFCKLCITKNLTRGVVSDIEENENWSCFNCTPKIIWPLRAQHWALIKYIGKQKKEILEANLPEVEQKIEMAKDHSTCCRLAKSRCGNMSDSLESLESATSRRSHSSAAKKLLTKASPSSSSQQAAAPAKRQKTNNDEVVCTPDLMSMLEPDCQITVANNKSPAPRTPANSAPKILSIQPNSAGGAAGSSATMTARNIDNAMIPNIGVINPTNTPPPLVLRNTSVQVRPFNTSPLVRRTVVSPRSAAPPNAPVYHTISGFRIDLNTAAQQETFRLPNGKLIQVKRQTGQATGAPNGSSGGSNNTNSTGLSIHPASPQQPQQSQQQPQPQQIQAQTLPTVVQQLTQQQQRVTPTILHQPGRAVQIQPATGPRMQFHIQPQPAGPPPASPIYQPQQQQPHQMLQAQPHPQLIRYNVNAPIAGVQQITHNGAQVQIINGAGGQAIPHGVLRPLLIRHVYPDTPIGVTRSQLQDQVFAAMDICQHLTGKIQSLTNSNAYKTVRNYMEIKELYIHLSYLYTYAIGRFKGLQDKCLDNMRELGFVSDANSLGNGQLAADKQASDNEDEDEIVIVEPKTDTITLDSDDDDDVNQTVQKAEAKSSPQKANQKILQKIAPKLPKTTQLVLQQRQQQQQQQQQQHQTSFTVTQLSPTTTRTPLTAQQFNLPPPPPLRPQSQPTVSTNSTATAAAATTGGTDNLLEFLTSSTILASLLDVDPADSDQTNVPTTTTKKQPRKKTTNKPNPTLIKQKELQFREKLEQMKRNDPKLKMRCEVRLVRIDRQYNLAKQQLAELNKISKMSRQKSKSNEKEIPTDYPKPRVVLVDVTKAKETDGNGNDGGKYDNEKYKNVTVKRKRYKELEEKSNDDSESSSDDELLCEMIRVNREEKTVKEYQPAAKIAKISNDDKSSQDEDEAETAEKTKINVEEKINEEAKDVAQVVEKSLIIEKVIGADDIMETENIDENETEKTEIDSESNTKEDVIEVDENKDNNSEENKMETEAIKTAQEEVVQIETKLNNEEVNTDASEQETLLVELIENDTTELKLSDEKESNSKNIIETLIEKAIENEKLSDETIENAQTLDEIIMEDDETENLSEKEIEAAAQTNTNKDDMIAALMETIEGDRMGTEPILLDCNDFSESNELIEPIDINDIDELIEEVEDSQDAAI